MAEQKTFCSHNQRSFEQPVLSFTSMENDIKNVGVIDRVIRTVIGIGLLLFAWEYSGYFIIATIAVIGGLAMLLSAATGFCFILRMLRIDTCKKRERE